MNNILARVRDKGGVVLHQCSVGGEIVNGSKEGPMCLVGVYIYGMIRYEI